MTARWLLGGALVLGLAACGDDGGSDAAAVPVSMTEYAYDPAPIRMETDGTLHLTNDGAEPHNLVIPELGKGVEVAPGGEADLHLDGQDPGTYRVICDLPGHLEQGMETELVID